MDEFLDDLTDWRFGAFLLWLLALIALIGVALALSFLTGSSTSKSGTDQGCPASYQAAGWC